MDEANPGMARGLENIPEREWTEIWQKLRIFIRRRYGYLGTKVGLDLDDFVQQAISDTLEGRRTWPPKNDDVSLFSFLCGTICSMVSNHLNKTKNNVLHWPGDQASISEAHHPRTQQSELPDQQVISKELLGKIREAVGDDQFLLAVMEKLLLGLTPKEIAGELRVDVSKVQNAQRRLKNDIKNLRKRLQAPMREGVVLAR